MSNKQAVLYGVAVESDGKLEIKTVTAIERKTTYKVPRVSQYGYCTRLQKTSPFVHLTPNDAIRAARMQYEKALARARKDCLRYERQLNELSVMEMEATAACTSTAVASPASPAELPDDQQAAQDQHEG
jgi:hypothetical protein